MRKKDYYIMPKERDKRSVAAGILFLVCLIIAIGVSIYYENSVRPKGLDTDEQKFSAERAKVHLETITKEPHPGGTKANEKVRDYIVKTLKSYGLKVEIQNGLAKIYDDLEEYGYVSNIIARLDGTDPNAGKILVLSHYDSAPFSHGANDDGTGVAAILEGIRVLKELEPLKNDVIFVFTDREEDMLYGANYFFTNHPDGQKVDFVLNFEARGVNGQSYMFQTGVNNYELINQFKKIDAPIRSNSMMNFVYDRMENNTDFSVYKDAGFQGMNFSYIGGAYYYHTPYDNYDNIGMDGLQHHGEYLIASLKHFGNLDLSQLASDKDAVFFDYLGKLFVYPQTFEIPLLIIFFVFLVIVLLLVSREKDVNPASILIATLLSIIIPGAGFGGIWAITKVFSNILPKGYKLTMDYYATGWGLAGIIVMSIGIWLLISQIIKRFSSKLPLEFGGLVVYLILAVVMTFLAKGTSFIFIIPGLLYGLFMILDAILGHFPWSRYFRPVPLLLIIPFAIHLSLMIYEGFGNKYAGLVAVFIILWIQVYEIRPVKGFKQIISGLVIFILGFGVMVANIYLEKIDASPYYAQYKTFDDGYVEVDTNHSQIAQELGLEWNKEYETYVSQYQNLNFPTPRVVVTQIKQITYIQYSLNCLVSGNSEPYGRYNLIINNQDDNIASIAIGTYYAEIKPNIEISIDISEIKTVPILITMKGDYPLKCMAYLSLYDQSIVDTFKASLPDVEDPLQVWVHTSKNYEWSPQ